MIGACLAWVVRLAFVAVFGLSAYGKLTSRQEARDAVAAFGIGSRWVNTAASALPVAELLVAVGLLLPWSAVAAAGAGLGLLALFTTMIAVQLARGNHPACACFGSATVGPVGRSTLIRNGVLMLLGVAAVILAVRYPQQPESLGADRATVLAAGVVLAAVQVWQGSTIRRLQRVVAASPPQPTLPKQLPVGAVAPEFDLPGAPDTPSTVAGLLAAGHAQILVFLHPECAPCRRVAGELPVWAQRLGESTDLTVISSGSVQDNELWSRDYGISRYLVQRAKEVSERYAVHGTPIAVKIGSDGHIASPLAVGAGNIRQLLAADATIG